MEWIVDDTRTSRMKSKIERLEAQLLACGHAIEMCESGKASMRSELYHSLDLTRVCGESREKYRTTIDGSVKTDLEQTISLLRVAVDRRLLTTHSLRAGVEQLRQEVRILRGAAPSANNGEGQSKA